MQCQRSIAAEVAAISSCIHGVNDRDSSCTDDHGKEEACTNEQRNCCCDGGADNAGSGGASQTLDHNDGRGDGGQRPIRSDSCAICPTKSDELERPPA